jgi:hypothetical protein
MSWRYRIPLPSDSIHLLLVQRKGTLKRRRMTSRLRFWRWNRQLRESFLQWRMWGETRAERSHRSSIWLEWTAIATKILRKGRIPRVQIMLRKRKEESPTILKGDQGAREMDQKFWYKRLRISRLMRFKDRALNYLRSTNRLWRHRRCFILKSPQFRRVSRRWTDSTNW